MTIYYTQTLPLIRQRHVTIINPNKAVHRTITGPEYTLGRNDNSVKYEGYKYYGTDSEDLAVDGDELELEATSQEYSSIDNSVKYEGYKYYGTDSEDLAVDGDELEL